MAKTIVIKAKNGLRIPRPESSYRYVEGDEPVEVDVSTFDNLAYWTRRIDHGEAEQLDEAAAKAHVEKKAAERAEEQKAEEAARAELAAKQTAAAVQTPALAATETPTAPAMTGTEAAGTSAPATASPAPEASLPRVVVDEDRHTFAAEPPPSPVMPDIKAEEK